MLIPRPASAGRKRAWLPGGTQEPPTPACQPQGAQSGLPCGRSPCTPWAAPASLASGEAKCSPRKAGSRPTTPRSAGLGRQDAAVSSVTKSKHCSLEKTQSFPAAASPLRLQGPGPRGAVLWGNLYFWARQLGSSGSRSGWEPAVSMTLSEDVGLTGPPEDLRQGEGPLQHPASVGSSAETLPPGKAGLGVAAPPTSWSARIPT